MDPDVHNKVYLFLNSDTPSVENVANNQNLIRTIHSLYTINKYLAQTIVEDCSSIYSVL